MFNGDEILPNPPTRNPSRGIETCGVVEAMFSYVSYPPPSTCVRTRPWYYLLIPLHWRSPPASAPFSTITN
jgi:hypothetical protein